MVHGDPSLVRYDAPHAASYLEVSHHETGGPLAHDFGNGHRGTELVVHENVGGRHEQLLHSSPSDRVASN